uniref:Rho GTPase-activating protein 20 n=1 Tax=Culex pipiens TaxID=7175 RepID=A0A8D8CUT1_CULPI
MSSWAQRMHRRAATLGSVVTSCGHPGSPYPHRLEKVKFGVPLDEVCKNDIPGPLLVLILKLNKEAPSRKDVFRAPGHQGAMKKLIHFLQQGRLVNVDNYSVYTIASVLKKFLRKIPGGVFGRDGETELFQIVDIGEEEVQQEKMHKLLMSLPGHTQRLLVLLFGTFRVIASNSERAATGMTSEALGVSVAPSFFQSCVSDGKTARMEDVLRFKVATKIMKQMIEQFAAYDLFGRDNYEYYARVTGRVLRVQDEWICSFRYPPPPRGKTAQQNYALKLALETEKTWLQCECERWGLIAQEESHSTPALLTTGGPNVGNSAISLGIIPEHSLLESCARLSVSLEGPGIFQGVGGKSSCSGSSHSSSSTTTRSGSQHHMTLDELRAVNRYAESTKSLSYLPQVRVMY